MDVNRTVLACGGGEIPIERPRARRTKETLFEPAGNARRAALPLSPGAAARASMFLSHRCKSVVPADQACRSRSEAGAAQRLSGIPRLLLSARCGAEGENAEMLVAASKRGPNVITRD